MDKEDKETIRQISETLNRILVVLQKPENKWVKIFEFAAASVGILGILSIIDIIKNWLGG
jgi:preprotein translocase subunit Sss1